MNVRRVLAATFLMLCATTVRAGSSGGTKGNTEVEIRQWMDQWKKVFAAHDLDGIMALYAPDVIAYDVVAPLQFVGKEVYRKDYQEFLAQYVGPIEVEFRDTHIFGGPDVAVYIGLERLSGTLEGLHYVAFSILMLHKAAPLFQWSS